MYSIGDLSQLGGVTPRMLRHYHELGLLIPADVDAATGYRRYDESQLAELRHILALKGLGLSLADIGNVVRGGVDAAELRGMLVLRRTQLRSELEEAAARLERVEAQILRLESQMSESHRSVSVVIKRLPAVHLAVASAVSPTFASADIGPVIQPLYPFLLESLHSAGVEITGPSIAYYDDAADGGIGVHAGFPIAPTVTEVLGLAVVDLQEVGQAATAFHLGDMSDVDVVTVAPMLERVHASGYRTTGYSRELYLECPEDTAGWRTEIQFPVEIRPERARDETHAK